MTFPAVYRAKEDKGLESSAPAAPHWMHKGPALHEAELFPPGTWKQGHDFRTQSDILTNNFVKY